MKKAILAMFMLIMFVICLTGCQKTPVTDADSLGGYLASIKERSDAIRSSLEHEELTQTDMNQKSKELRDLWESALDHLLEEAKKALPDAEQEQFAAEQSAWYTGMLTAVEAEGKAYEGGSLYPLVVNMEAARLMEDRVDQLYELLK